MQSHHTITIRIPTKLILTIAAAVLVGLLVGLVLIGIDAAGIELLTPVFGLPLVIARPATTVASAAPVPVSVPVEPVAVVELDAEPEHPAIVHWRRVPTHVQRALDDMVDRVLIEKARAA